MPTPRKTTTRKTTARKTTTRKTTGAARKKVAADAAVSMNSVTQELRQQMIEKAAYHRAEMREFTNGNPSEDWFEAEKEVDSFLAQRTKHI